MNLYLFIKQALGSIRANKLRSFLSTLGIIIGIASFVIMLSLGEGAKASILKEFEGSSDLITVEKKESTNPFAKDILTEKIAIEIKEKVPGVKNTFTIFNPANHEIFYGEKSIYGQVYGLPKNYLDSKNLEVIYGSDFSDKDYKDKSRLVIIGNKLVKQNFKKENPLGKKITIGGEVFIIAGLLKEKNWTFDYSFYIPETTLKDVFNVEEIREIEVIVEDEEKMDAIKKDLEYFLYKKSAVENKKDVAFRAKTNKEQLKQVQGIIAKFSLLLGGIGAISLIVGGIGIMNIMLVSVTERTREIGIRKAIGATNGNILTQFLVESIILTLIGSLIAIMLSYGVVKVIDMFIPDFSPLINFNVIMIATGVSIGMGILFGLMPAYKAAKLKPIDALHFE